MYKEIIDLAGNKNSIIKKITDGSWIPMVDGNRDYEEYKKWLEEGNTPEPADE